MRFPLGLVVPVLVAPLELQAVRLFDVEHGVTADHRRAGALALGRPVGRRGRRVDRAGLLLLPLVVKLVEEHLGGLLAFANLTAYVLDLLVGGPAIVAVALSRFGRH